MPRSKHRSIRIRNVEAEGSSLFTSMKCFSASGDVLAARANRSRAEECPPGGLSYRIDGL